MKKLILLLMSVVMLTALTGCSDTDEREPGETRQAGSASMRYLTFEQLVDTSTDAIKGTCVDMIEYDTYVE